MTAEEALALKKGDWLKTEDGAWYSFVCRRKKKPGVVVLKHMGSVSCASRRGHRPELEYPESFLTILERFA